MYVKTCCRGLEDFDPGGLNVVCCMLYLSGCLLGFSIVGRHFVDVCGD